MSLNIKNERVHTLAREVAARTGQTQTSAIEQALREMLNRLDREAPPPPAARRMRVEQILAAMDAEPVQVELTPDDLYDDAGLPA